MHSDNKNDDAWDGNSDLTSNEVAHFFIAIQIVRVMREISIIVILMYDRISH